MDVLVTGAGGLLGREVTHLLSTRGMRVHALTRAELDVTDEGGVREAVGGLKPQAVVHCAAMTDVDACEQEPERARTANALGSGHVAAAAAEVGAEVVAVSTDYVFGGGKAAPYVEDDPTDPIQVYGRTKRDGEELVRDANPRHYVVRSAWIYGPGGKNFLSRLPELVAAGTPIKAVADQRGSPTYAPDLAMGIDRLLGSGMYGTYHVVNEGACSFLEFCRYALELLGGSTEIGEILRADLGRPAPRPADTSLDAPAWRAAGFPALRPWPEAAKAFCS